MKSILVSTVALGALIVGLAGPAGAGASMANGLNLTNGLTLANGADRGLNLEGVILPEAAE
jgi:hypothetical protein